MNWTSCCSIRCGTTVSRMRSPMRSSCRGGHGARSMPARSNCRSGATRKKTMAKTSNTHAGDIGAEAKTAKTAAPARVAAFRTGVSAEARAAAYLMAKGYRILAKRFRTPVGEIDLVARRRNLLVFVEVKARATLDEAAYAVTPRQQRRIVDAAQAWLMAHPEHAEFELRFDAMLIAPRHLPRHLLAAFDASP